MTILAATLAGGDNNQDRYIIGDNFAAVLDGATSVAGDRSHDPGWYAQQLAHALSNTVPDGRPLPEAVAAAIRTVRDAHGLTPDTTPTSTVALARWTPKTIETYVLGDSLVVLLHDDGTETIHTDQRLDTAAAAARMAYRTRLTTGGGYDAEHRALLLDLQAEQAQLRNRPGGFWIAGAEPEAAHHGIRDATRRSGMTAVILATDGVAIKRHPTASTWRDLYDEVRRHGPSLVLEQIHNGEEIDSDGERWPRAKLHDDKTLVVIGAVPTLHSKARSG